MISLPYIKRYFGYTFWVALEMMVIIGLPRLVIFPVAARLIGKEEFGVFLFALGIAMTIGHAPAAGLITGVIRHIADFEKQEKDVLVSTSIHLCRLAMLFIIAIALVAIFLVRSFLKIDLKVVWCLVPLMILLYSWNLFQLQMVRYRVERRFALRTGWCSIWSLLLFISIPSAIIGGVVGMAWGFMFGYVMAHVILSWRQRILFRNVPYDARKASLLKTVWLHMSIASVLGFSSRYIYRIVLGVFDSFSNVSILFGATNIISLFMGPMNVLSSLLLSMFGKFSRLEDVGWRQKYTILGVAISITVVSPILLLAIGPFLLSVMFPEFSVESIRVMRSILMVIPCVVISSISLPIIQKFGPIKCIPWLNFIILMSRLIPSVLLIPRFGLRGAVISYNVGFGISAVAWLVALIWTFKFYGGPEVATGELEVSGQQ